MAGLFQIPKDETILRGNVEFSRSWLDLDKHSARMKIIPYGMQHRIAKKRVLCSARSEGSSRQP
jgi:hypothetical protein